MAKINLIQVKDKSFYCDSLFSIGVYIKEKMAVLIDSGISRDVAKEIKSQTILFHIRLQRFQCKPI